MSQLMRLWYLSHRRPAKAQASLRIRAVSPEPSLFAHIKYGSRQMVWPKLRHLAPLDGCACTFEEWVYGGRKVPYAHAMAQIMFLTCMFLGKKLDMTEPLLSTPVNFEKTIAALAFTTLIISSLAETISVWSTRVNIIFVLTYILNRFISQFLVKWPL